MDTYTPAPIPTTGVELPGGLDELVELLAKHNHDHWARQRIEEGWVHGSERSDALHTHPGLVHYDDLSESEKEYDRTSVVETLRAIVSLGYEIRLRKAQPDEPATR